MASGVVSTFKPLTEWLGLDKYKIDNVIFQLHSKVTVGILMTFSLIVTAQQFIGDPIDCIVSPEIPPQLMDTYCWIHSTFTLPKRILENDYSLTAHPGVGNQGSDEEVAQHKYYQWVCFTLFFQALIFYVPRYLWRVWENKRIKNLIPSDLLFNVDDNRMPLFPKPRGILSDDVIDGHLKKISDYLVRTFSQHRITIHKTYFIKFQWCEWLNLINVIFQIFFVNMFLDGMFTTYGTMVWSMSNLDPNERTDPMSLVFPKVTKCTFHKSGPTGTIENYDGMCVLPINIINEKIYIFMWFWFIFLAVVTCLFQLYRILTLFSRPIRSYSLQAHVHLLVSKEVVDRLVSYISCGEWFFLCQLGTNLDPNIFALLLKELDKCLTSRNMPLANGASSTAMNEVKKLA